MKIDHTLEKVDSVISQLSRTTDEIFSLQHFKNLLLSGKKLTLKYGVDVTAPYLHIGHAVNLWMYRALQDLGHKVIFLVGDFTTTIGDPTGKNKTRPMIDKKEIENNGKEFIRQALMVLKNDPEVLEIKYNSEWYNKMPLNDFLNLCSMVTNNKLLTRDMFKKRVEEHSEIYMHELLYPVLQGFDSVALHADVTIIGSDQLFNEMMGRFLQEKFDQTPQVIITSKITPGIDGKAKQSKSLNNYIGLGHSPKDKFGRIMSIPDELIEQYFLIYTDLNLSNIKDFLDQGPRDAKLALAENIVLRYHGAICAAQEKENFISTFSKKEVPNQMPIFYVAKHQITAFELVCTILEGKESKQQINRLFMQNGIRVNSKSITKNDIIALPAILNIGKHRWYEILQSKTSSP